MIPNLYIAQTKRKFGMEVGVNYNLSKKDSHSAPQCPPEKELMIIEAIKHFRMMKIEQSIDRLIFIRFCSILKTSFQIWTTLNGSSSLSS